MTMKASLGASAASPFLVPFCTASSADWGLHIGSAGSCIWRRLHVPGGICTGKQIGMRPLGDMTAQETVGAMCHVSHMFVGSNVRLADWGIVVDNREDASAPCDCHAEPWEGSWLQVNMLSVFYMP